MHPLIPTLLKLAKDSGLWPTTSEDQWIAHFDFCLNRAMCRVIYHNKKPVGFTSWYKTNDYKNKTMYGTGKYIVVSTLYIDPEYRKFFNPFLVLVDTVINLIKLGKMKEVKYIMWNRATRNRDNKWTIFKLLKTGGLKWVVEAELKS